MDETGRVRVVVRVVLSGAFGKAQDAAAEDLHVIAARNAFQQFGNLAHVDLRYRVQIGQVCHRTGMAHQGEALHVKAASGCPCIPDQHFLRGQRDKVLFVRVGVEIGPFLRAFGIADGGANVCWHGALPQANSSVSIVGRMAS